MILPSDLEKFDSYKMYKVYDMWPQIARDAYESEFEEISFDEINHTKDIVSRR